MQLRFEVLDDEPILEALKRQEEINKAAPRPCRWKLGDRVVPTAPGINSPNKVFIVSAGWYVDSSAPHWRITAQNEWGQVSAAEFMFEEAKPGYIVTFKFWSNRSITACVYADWQARVLISNVLNYHSPQDWAWMHEHHEIREIFVNGELVGEFNNSGKLAFNNSFYVI